ncbi:MAG: fibronectin type III domain-containing protein [Lachnoclostridium sp.]|jgi:hypothetical protein|nr:fibronectin type III domain-containing protein [Lachnoclostridium sp.]
MEQKRTKNHMKIWGIGVIAVLLMLLPMTGTTAESSFGSAVPVSLGVMNNGWITQYEQVGYYMFTLPSAGQIKVTTENYLDGFGFLGTQIYDSDNRNRALYSEYCPGNQYFLLELDRGTYYLKFVGGSPTDDYSGCFGEYNFKIEFTSAGVNHTEPNNVIGASAKISLGGTIRGHIAENNEIDFYTFGLLSKGQLKINIENYLSHSYLGAQIYDSNKRMIYERSFSSKENFTLELNKGTYYMKFVGGYPYEDYSSYFGEYNFKLTFTKFTKPKAVKLKALRKSGTAVTAKWKRIRGVDGYQLIYSRKKSFKGKKSVDLTASETKSTIYLLKSRKTYYFKVRAYKNFAEEKNYGKFGNVKKVKIKR